MHPSRGGYASGRVRGTIGSMDAVVSPALRKRRRCATLVAFAISGAPWAPALGCHDGSSPVGPPAADAPDAGDSALSPDLDGSDSGEGDAASITNGSLVWIGAHPDDELYAAPFLADACVAKKMACTFLVLTRGESGNCKLAGGCAPDLATVRDQELAPSAAHFGAMLLHWDLGDGTSASAETVAKNWDARRSGTLVADVGKVIAGASIIVSFDPRHGDSCHPDHRAAGAVAILARRANPSAPFVTMVASKTVLAPAVLADTAVLAFDASVVLPSLGRTGWSFLVDTLKTHASQFTAAEVAALAGAPPAQQRTYLLSEKDAVENDPRYANVCP